MKSFILSLFGVLIYGFSLAQVSYGTEKSGRFITVTGTAEKEVTPDIIYLNISLKEYYLDKDEKNKIFIEDLERNFQRIALDNGLGSENIAIESISGFTHLTSRKKTDSFLAGKTYKLKINDLDKINNILDKLDPKALTSVYVSGYDFSQIEQVKKELRIQAMLNAKSKAAYCLSAVNESLGSLLETEIDETSLNQPIGYSSSLFKANNPTEPAPNADSIDFKKLKLSATVHLKFQIH
jgi:uncharacterized protein YggE